MADANGTKPLLDALVTQLADPENVLLARSILGTTEVEAMARFLQEFVLHHTGRHIVACCLCEFSVGAVFGLHLDDGQRVFLKAYVPPQDLDALHAVSQVQHALATTGFPCPRVLVFPAAFGHGVAALHAFVDAGEYRDAHHPQIRRAMAALLARLVRETREFRGVPGLPTSRLPPNALWPVPHNALFDFAHTSAGAEWIDRIASRAKTLLGMPVGETVLGHSDWSAKHFRFERSRVRVVYDWDSLVLENECVLVGSAATHFPVTWYLPVRLPPTPEEAEQFVREYEDARSVSFTHAEHRQVAAAATYAIAYTARCEHAIDLQGKRYAGSFREALAAARKYDYLSV